MCACNETSTRLMFFTGSRQSVVFVTSMPVSFQSPVCTFSPLPDIVTYTMYLEYYIVTALCYICSVCEI